MPESRPSAHTRGLAAIGAGALTLSLSAVGVLVDAPAAHAVTVSNLGAFVMAVFNEEPEILLDPAADETWVLASTVAFLHDVHIAPAPDAGGRVTFAAPPGEVAFSIGGGVTFEASGFDITGDPTATAVSAAGSNLMLADITIRTASAGLSTIAASLTATGVTFEQNGVGIDAAATPAMTLTGVAFVDNGGGLRFTTAGGVVDIVDAMVLRNGGVAANTGGIRFIATDGATVSIRGGEFRGNRAVEGGGLMIDQLTDSRLIVEDVTFIDNTADLDGGAIAAAQSDDPYAIDLDAEVLLDGVRILENRALVIAGGIAIPAIQGGATVTIRDSTIDGNVALEAAGAAISSPRGGADVPALLVERSTFSRNTAQLGVVGGLMLSCGVDDDPDALVDARIVNSTLSANSAPELASAIGIGCFGADDLLVEIVHTTVTANTGQAPASLAVFNVAAVVSNTAIGGNANSSDVFAEDADLTVDYSLIQTPDSDTAIAMGAGSGNISGAAPELGPLADNGGPTETHLPTEGGNLVDAGGPAFAPPPATDQRGEPRLVAVLDIGAVEVQAVDDPGSGDGDSGALPATGASPAGPLGVGLAALAVGALLIALRRGRQGRSA